MPAADLVQEVDVAVGAPDVPPDHPGPQALVRHVHHRLWGGGDGVVRCSGGEWLVVVVVVVVVVAPSPSMVLVMVRGSPRSTETEPAEVRLAKLRPAPTWGAMVRPARWRGARS